MRARPAFLMAFMVLTCSLAADTGDTKPADLKDAAARLAQAASPAEYASALDAFSTSLPPIDALALLNQCLASTGTEYRESLLIKAGDLALLLDLFGDAASRYEEAAALDPASGGRAKLLLRAARSFLAAGDPEKASRISSDIVLGTVDSDLAGAARLVGAWSLALQGRPLDAQTIAASLLGGSGESAATLPGLRREARFILWLCAVDDKVGAERKARADALAAEFPGSAEALIASGAAFPPPLPHWYLGGLTGAPPMGAVPETKPAAKPALPAVATTEPVVGAPPIRAKRLQVGYFSLEENAQALKDELASKRFVATVEIRSRAVGSGKAEEKRWIVVVEGGKDIAKTILSLKDAGYESYVID
jgi:hypothetical protein